MNKTDDILEKLKHAPQPVIDNPEELTEMIMSLLPASPEGRGEEKREGRSINLIPFVRAVLSMAAMWIIGFFIYLQFEGSTPLEAGNCMLSDVPQNGATLREVYKNRLCQECKKTISYTKIRSKLYENK